MRTINQAGLDLLKKWESCRLQAYKDIAGIWTVGYGHTGPDVTPGMVITQAQADELLETDLEKFYHLDEYLSEMVNDNQYSALVVLAYNIGLRALKLSTLIKDINNGTRPDDDWLKFSYAKVDGVETRILGLVNRRKAELKLFNTVG